MYTYLLLFFIIFLLLVTLACYHGDFMHPCAVVLEVYLLSTCFLITEIKKWDAYISEKTFLIIVLGLTVYVVVSYLSSRFSGVGIRRIRSKNAYRSVDNPIDNNKTITVIVCLFSFIVVFMTFRDVRSIAASIGNFSTFGQMTGLFRNASVNGVLEIGLSRSTRYGSLMLAALAYIYLYIDIQMAVLKVKHKKMWWFLHIIPIIAYMANALITGSRNPILQIFIAAITLYFILHNKFYKKNQGFRLKFAIKMAILGCLVLFLFSTIRGIVGRTSDLDAWDYIAKYTGAPIKLLDMYISSPKEYSRGNLWGQETFVNVWRFIGQRTGDSYMSSLVMNKEWRNINGFPLGNVYTAFREYYADFGIVGVVILTAVHSFIFSNFYMRLNKEKHKIVAGEMDFGILIYAYLAQSLFYFSIDDRLFQSFLSYSTLQTVLILFVLIKVMLRLKIGGKRRFKG